MESSADEQVVAGVATARSALAGLASGVWSDVGDKALLAAVEDAHKLATQAQATALAALAELDRRGVCQTRFGIDTAAWLADKERIARGSARAQVRTATETFGQTPVVAAALERAELTVEHAKAISYGLGVVPLDLTAEDHALVQKTLVGYAAQFTPREVRQLTNHAVEVVAPDQFEQWQARLLDQQEQRARRSRMLTWQWTDQGTLRLVAVLDTADGEVVVSAIQRCTSDGNDLGQACDPDEDGRQPPRADQSGPAERVGRCPAPVSQRRADALVCLARRAIHADPQTPPAGSLATAFVTLDLAVLTDQISTAGTLLGSAEPLTAQTCRRLACDADLIPVLLDSDGVPLDRGRQVRLFDTHQRMLLAQRDAGCAFPGWDRPPIDCHAHHIVPWWDGGPTDFSNGVLVCAFHHRLVEPKPGSPPGSRWEVRLDQRGLPEFLPPSRYDPQRCPRQHSRFQTPGRR